jgi:hypothetical protein
MNWNEIGLWFITSVLGAGIIKLIDMVANRYSTRRTRTEAKVAKLLDHIKEFGELEQLYGFFANVSSKVVKDDSGKFVQDESGKFIVENKNLELEPRFEEAIKSLKGTDINSAIAQKIASIRINSSEALDVAMELNPSGELSKQFDKLYAKTVWTIDMILRDKNTHKPLDNFDDIMEAFKDANEVRRKLRADVQKYLKS